jgi:hypothetical protein
MGGPWPDPDYYPTGVRLTVKIPFSVLDKKSSNMQSQEEMFLQRIDRLTEENESILKELEDAETKLERIEGEGMPRLPRF